MSDNVTGYFLVKANMIDQQTGISKKIHSQIKAMNNNGLNCMICKQQYRNKSLPGIKGKLERYLPWGNINPVWDDIPNIKDIDFLYFRHPKTIYSSMLKYLISYKSQNPKLKIFMELPTYPYEYEYTGIKNQYLLLIDKHYRTKLNGLIDGIFVSDAMHRTGQKLYGVDCVRFSNGYDVENTTVPVHIKQTNNTIVLTCVAMFSFWHGYERLLYGLKNYVESGPRDYSFLINFVGEGPELNFYKRLVKENSLGKFVIFHGKKFGKELDYIYANTDIGISCLGCYKKRIDVIGDLKTREYLAKGIPTISGCKVDLFEKKIDTEYYREIPNDQTPVYMDDIICFYEFIEEKRKMESVENSLHEYSIKKFDYNRTILPITEKINNEVNKYTDVMVI